MQGTRWLAVVHKGPVKAHTLAWGTTLRRRIILNTTKEYDKLLLPVYVYLNVCVVYMYVVSNTARTQHFSGPALSFANPQ